MSMELDISELNEYAEGMIEFGVNEMPNVAKKFMRKEATKLRKKAADKTKAVVGKKTGNLYKRIKKGKIVYAWGDAQYNIRVYNGAPHAHLIEYGHRMVGHKPNKTFNGLYVRGYHPNENANIEFQPTFYKDVETDLVEMVEEELEK